MTTGTKIFLAVFAAFIGVLVLYYGVLMPEAQTLPAISAATRDIPNPAKDQPTAIPTNDPSVVPQAGETTLPSAPSMGILTEAMQPAANDPLTQPSVVPGVPIDTAIGPASTPPPTTHVASPAATPETASTPIANQPVSIADTPGRPQPATSPKPPATQDYTVKSGDTMSSIAEAWFGDAAKWSLIAKENPRIDPNRLTIGQKLRLPSKDAKPATVKEQASGEQPLYTVRSGDTLSRIAREYYGDVGKWKAIYDANKSVIGSDPADLKIGMKLKLPPPSKPASN